MRGNKNIRFTTKLFASILVILALSIVTVISVTTVDVRKGLLKLGRTSIENMCAAVYNSIAAQHALQQEKLASDMVFLEGELARYGSFALDESVMLERTIVNQVTKAEEKVKMPRLMLGGTVINDNTGIVDKVQQVTGVAVTIFQVLDGKLLRVSTNVMTEANERAVGTFIPSDSPVYKAVMGGKTYSGRAFVVNEWYVTTYKPVFDFDDKLVAVLFVGRKILTPQLREMIVTTKAAGVGYIFVYNSKGELLIHPTLEGKNLFEVPGAGPLFRDSGGGFVEYDWEGRRKLSYTMFFEPWDWHIGVGLNEDDMLAGLDRQIVLESVLVGAVVMVLGVAVVIFLVRTIAKPLNLLAEQSLKVADGDYSIVFTHQASDAIGNLSSALNTMVERTKGMLREMSEATRELSTSSARLTDTARQMTEGSMQTTEMANTVNQAAGDVSENMVSVSAAMEEAAVNMTSVATAAEEMSATIQEIARNAERARATTSSAVHKSRETSGRVHELGAAAKEISAVTSTIMAISSQTNLLALNATIEAARAGEAGRGFAVVANEIKELAQQTAQATEDIRDRIAGIQSVTTRTVGDIADIAGVIGEMDEIVGSIAASVEEQSATTREIAENVGQASSGISEINENVMASSTMTRSISADIGKVRAASVTMTDSSRTVQESSAELTGLAERLSSQVSRFTI